MKKIRYNKQILDETKTEIDWLRMSTDALRFGIGSVVVARAALKRLNRNGDLTGKWAKIEFQKMDKLGKQDIMAISNAFINRSIVVYLSSILENFVRRTIEDIIIKNSTIRITKIDDLKVNIGDLHSAYSGNIGKLKADVMLNEVIGTRIGIETWESAFSDIGLTSSVNSAVRKNIRELTRVRNAIAHRNACADSRLIKELGYKIRKRNGKIHILDKDNSKYFGSVLWYIFEIKQRILMASTGVRNVDLDNAMRQSLISFGITKSLA